MDEVKNLVSHVIDVMARADAWVTKPRKIPVAASWSPEKDLGWTAPFIPWVIRLIYVMVLMLSCYNIGYYIFFAGPPGESTDPRHQNEIATPAPTVAEHAATFPWQSWSFLSPAEAMSLRVKANVVNFAILSRGEARYSRDFSLQFVESSPWVRARGANIQTLAISGTSVAFTSAGQDYVLNVLQPFIPETSSQTVYIVSQKGELWQAELSAVAFIKLNEVRLPVGILPNGDLSFTYK